MSEVFHDPHFELDERLKNDTLLIAQFPLCDVLMMNETRYPWFVLVPRISNLRELYELSSEQRSQFDLESDRLSRAVMSAFKGEKLNVAALGNVVSQLHVHHIVRFENDAAWPAPVWGKFPVEPMSEALIDERRSSLVASLEPFDT